MDFTVIGNLNSYMKAMEHKTTFQLKQQNGELSSHGITLDDMLTSARTGASQGEENADSQLEKIRQKAYSGESLSPDEKAYLLQKDPLTYTKLCAIEQEQNTYEQELKRCKTKADAQRLRMSRLGAALDSVKHIENNPSIPAEKKQQLINLESRRSAVIEETTQKFVRSGELEKLPAEAEQSKAFTEENKTEQPESEASKKVSSARARAAYAAANVPVQDGDVTIDTQA